MAGEPVWDLFLVHPKVDEAAARELYHQLAGRRRVFLKSVSIQPGESWDEVRPRAQAGSRLTVVLWSGQGAWDHYDREDIAAAVELLNRPGTSHKLIPVWLDEDAGTREVYGLQRLHPLKVDTIRGMAGVAEGLERLLDGLPAEVSPPPDEITPHDVESPDIPPLSARAKAALALVFLGALGLLTLMQWTPELYQLRPVLDYLYPSTRMDPYPEVHSLAADTNWVVMGTRGGMALVDHTGEPEKNLGVREGLPSALVHSVSLTPSGVWIGTSQGPCFAPWDNRPECLGAGPTPQDTPDPLYARGWATLQVASHPQNEGCLYTVLENFDLQAFVRNTGQINPINHPPSPEWEGVQDLAFLDNTTLLTLHPDVLLPLTTGPETCRDLVPGTAIPLPAGEMQVLVVEDEHHVWAGGSQALCEVELPTKVVKCLSLLREDGNRIKPVRSILPLGDKIWVGTEDNLYLLQRDTLGKGGELSLAPEPPGVAVLTLAIVPGNDPHVLWVGTLKGALRCLSDGTRCLSLATRPAGFEAADITTATQGSVRPFWVGDSVGNLHTIFRPPGSLTPRLETLSWLDTRSDGLGHLRSVRALLEHNRQLWIGMAQGLWRLPLTPGGAPEGSPQPVTFGDARELEPLPPRVDALDVDPSGRVWVATPVGLYTGDDHSSIVHRHPLPTRQRQIHSVRVDREERLWLTHPDGFTCLLAPGYTEECNDQSEAGRRGGSWEGGAGQEIRDTLAQGAQVVWEDRQEEVLWIGTTTGQLIYLPDQGGRLSTPRLEHHFDERDGARTGPVVDIHRDSAANLWVIQGTEDEGTLGWFRAANGQWNGPLSESARLSPLTWGMTTDRDRVLWVGDALALPPPQSCDATTTRNAAIFHELILSLAITFWLLLWTAPEVPLARQNPRRAEGGALLSLAAGMGVVAIAVALPRGLADQLGGPLRRDLHSVALLLLVATQAGGLALARAEARGRRRFLIPLVTLASGIIFLSVRASLDRMSPLAPFNCLGEAHNPVFWTLLNVSTAVVVAAPLFQAAYSWMVLRQRRRVNPVMERT